MDIRSILENTSNRLLHFMSAADRQLLALDLKQVALVQRQTLEKSNQTIEHVYFLEDGIASVVGDSNTFGQIEIGIIGKEGMTGLQVVLGNDRSPYETFIQIPGNGLRIEAEKLRAAMDKSSSLQQLLLRYVQVFMIQTSQTALSNAAALLTQRLARWLLMCEDRLISKHIPLTHEFLAMMLGVQRSGVTIALGELESRNLIRGKRGLITIMDRPTLEKMTNGSYGVAEAEYKRRFRTPKALGAHSPSGRKTALLLVKTLCFLHFWQGTASSYRSYFPSF
jgi:CRP-like cAMP-binding protein